MAAAHKSLPLASSFSTLNVKNMLATETRNCTLLLVEDSADELFFMRRAWSTLSSQYHLGHVSDGEEAKAFLGKLEEDGNDLEGELPKLILSDLVMPHCNGLALLSWVRAHPRFKHIPFVIWSTSQSPADIDAAYANGANGYLFKPRNSTEEAGLLAKIQQFWSEPQLKAEQWRLPYPV